MMSDDLIKQLRGLTAGPSAEMQRIGNEAADRIEQLEAKLAKAVEALREIASYDTGPTAGLAYTASTVLAELEAGGEPDKKQVG